MSYIPAPQSNSTAPAPLLPSSVKTAQLTMWCSADVGVCSDTAGTVPATVNGSVGFWRDRSGMGNNPAQPTTSAQPTLVTDAAGFAAINFNGSQALTHYDGSEPACVIVVYRMYGITDTSTNRSYCLLHCNDTTGSKLGAYWLRAMSDDAGAGFSTRHFLRVTAADSAASSSNPPAYQAWHTSSPVVGAWDCFSGTINGGQIQTFKGMVPCGPPATINAWPLNTSEASTQGGLYSTAGGLIGLGIYNGGFQGWFHGNIAEIVKFSTVPSTAEFRGVIAYLQAKYPPLQPPTGMNYVWPCFTGAGTTTTLNENGLVENLSMLCSNDGLNWTYRPTHYTPPAGFVARDMSMIYWNGQLLLAHSRWTGSACPLGFDVASSTDGFNFAPLQFANLSTATGMPTSISGGGQPECWAPEWVVNEDHSAYLIGGLPCALVSLFGGGNPSASTYYIVQPTTAAMTAWTVVGQLSGLPTGIIDGFIRYDRVAKMFTVVICNSQRMSMWQSTSLLGSYTEVGSGTDPYGWSAAMPNSSNANNEGPSIMRVNGQEWAYFDNDGSGYYVSHNTSIASTGWSTPTLISAPFVPQHGTPMPTSACGGLIV